MKAIKVKYAGIQQSRQGNFELWTLLEPIPNHPRLSTVSRQTIESQGYKLMEV